MDKSFLKYGLITGAIISVLLALTVYKLVIYVPSFDFNKIELVDLNGQKVDINSLKSKPLVINCWATWCAPCVEELPYFEEVSLKYKNEVNFIFVSDEEMSKIIKFKERKKLNLFYAKSLKSIGTIGINVRPTTYFFKENGVLETSKTGMIEKSALEELIKSLIEK